MIWFLLCKISKSHHERNNADLLSFDSNLSLFESILTRDSFVAPADDTKYIGDTNSRVDLDLPKAIKKQTLSSCPL